MRATGKAAGRFGGPLTLAAVVAAVVVIGGGASSGLSASGQRTAAQAQVTSQPAPGYYKPPLPPLPAPKTGPPTPIPLDPVSVGPLPVSPDAGKLLVGIKVRSVELPYDHKLFTTTSFYEFAPTTVYTELAAGSFAIKPDQGVLRVVVLNPHGSNGVTDYPAPMSTGALTMTSVVGDQIHLVSSTGKHYIFNISLRTFR